MTNRHTILVVEDDYNLMQGIRDILALQDYDVLTANNGQDGINVLQAAQDLPDLIVSDIMMPRMNGYEFYEALRSETRWATIPFIFLTARGEKADIRAGKLLGVDDYIVKPFSAEDLLIVIEGKLRRRKELQQVHSAEISDIKQNILTILNHEFRTPLTYIVAYADLLNTDMGALDYHEMKSFLSGMNTGAERLRRLIESFILLVDLETGEAARIFGWRQKPIDDIRPMLAEVHTQYTQDAQNKQLQLKLEIGVGLLPAISGDIEYLRLALERLVDNAIKFSDRPDSVITISAYADDDWLYLEVEDQGRGIPSDELHAIFETFYQIDRTTFEDQGAGIGLPITKRIVELHQGKIDVESTVGQGSRFVIALPLLRS